MNILIEGADGSGKTTLAKLLAEQFKRRIIHSKGPEQWPGELNDRARAFLAQRDVIFDRHPCVGERIYYVIRGNGCKIDTELVLQFYDSNPLIIYCSDPDGKFRHAPRKEEDPKHIRDVETNRVVLVNRYKEWALRYAHIHCRAGEDNTRITDLVRGVIV